MPKYRVLRPTFHGGILRKPDGKHNILVTAKPLSKKKMGIPSDPIFELIDEEAEAAAREAAAEVAAQTTADQMADTEDESSEEDSDLNQEALDFSGDNDANESAGVETL